MDLLEFDLVSFLLFLLLLQLALQALHFYLLSLAFLYDFLLLAINPFLDACNVFNLSFQLHTFFGPLLHFVLFAPHFSTPLAFYSLLLSILDPLPQGQNWLFLTEGIRVPPLRGRLFD